MTGIIRKLFDQVFISLPQIILSDCRYSQWDFTEVLYKGGKQMIGSRSLFVH